MSGKRVSNGYASLCVNWKRTRSLNGKSGAFLRPHLQHLQILCTSLHYPTLSPSIIQAYLFITITLYLLWIFGDDQNAFFSLANVFYVRRCRGAGATGKSQHGRCRQRAVVWLAKTNFMWWKMTVVLWKPSPKNITSAFSLCYRLTPALILTYRARAAC